MAAPLYTTASGQLYHAGKILIATVGLPARGKTHLSHALERYLRWLGVKASALSLGDYRRKVVGGAERLPPDYFYDGPKAPGTEQLRKKILAEFDDTVLDFFTSGGQVVIYDANNGTQDRRYAIRETFGKLGIHVMFLESICTDKAIVEANVRSVKISSPDYVNWDPEKAVQDFYKRITGHEKHYEPIENPSFPYIKVINVGEKIIVNNIQGYLQSRVVFFLMNIHNRQRTIYFARAGEALIEHLYKADADLSSLGWQYSQKLAEFITKHRKEATAASQKRARDGQTTPGGHEPGTGPGESGRLLEVWTSARKRSAHTALAFADQGYRVIERSQLSEINPGVVDGLSQEEIRAKFPDEWDKKINDPYAHRYPRAESYHDLSIRLEPIIFELERATNDVLIVGQSSVLRCLIAYCQGRKPQEIPSIQVKEGEVWEMSPKAYGISTQVHQFWDPVGERQKRDETYFRERTLSDSMDRLSASTGTLQLQQRPSGMGARTSLFRPCIDIHEGKVKQIVGGTLTDGEDSQVKTNFVATHPPAYYAQLYRQHNLTGGHVIKLGPRNDTAAEEALCAWPGSLQVGGGITESNAQDWILKGASKVIVTSYLFPEAKFSLSRLQAISSAVGPDHLVVDISCRRKDSKWIVAMNRWQDLTDMEVNEQSIKLLSQYCSEFLIHAADVEGLCKGIDTELISKLKEWLPSDPDFIVTYAGGGRHMGDLDLINQLSDGKIDLTFGSALDIFGGNGITLSELIQWNHRAEISNHKRLKSGGGDTSSGSSTASGPIEEDEEEERGVQEERRGSTATIQE
ncbi:unnamed protein product [Sympodiomycopsis kandeliae]